MAGLAPGARHQPQDQHILVGTARRSPIKGGPLDLALCSGSPRVARRSPALEWHQVRKTSVRPSSSRHSHLVYLLAKLAFSSPFAPDGRLNRRERPSAPNKTVQCRHLSKRNSRGGNIHRLLCLFEFGGFTFLSSRLNFDGIQVKYLLTP